jgi:chromosome segregation ATPase
MTFGNWKGDKFVPSVSHTEELRAALDTAIRERNEYWKESERLQAELDDRTGRANIRMMDQNAEIERLRATVADKEKLLQIACDEIERLKGLCDEYWHLWMEAKNG